MEANTAAAADPDLVRLFDLAENYGREIGERYVSLRRFRAGWIIAMGRVEVAGSLAGIIRDLERRLAEPLEAPR